MSLEGANHTVTITLINADRTSTAVNVNIGVVGETCTEITSGDISSGQLVVLTDIEESLPGSATEVNEPQQVFQGPGGFQGAAFPPFD